MAESGGAADTEMWLAAMRRACDRIGEAARTMSPAERCEPCGAGAGGDTTVMIDRVAEDIVIEELEALGRPLRVVSEEIGETTVAGGGSLVAVIDPIDGSLNAKRGLPIFSTSIALAEGPTMADVTIGLVRDHGTGEEWVAERGRGAWLDGNRLAPDPPAVDGSLELLLLEGAFPASVRRLAEGVGHRVGRFRALGSLALSLCHTASGRGDAMVGLGPGRSVDIAAAQLIAREAGLLVGLPRAADLAGTPLDLRVRFHVAAARDAETLTQLARAATSDH